MQNFWERALNKTALLFREGLQGNNTVTEAASSTILLDEEGWDNLELALLQTDMGLYAAERALSFLKERHRNGSSVSLQGIETSLQQWGLQVLQNAWNSDDTLPFSLENGLPENQRTVVMLLGVNGSGKTTTLSKLANWAQQKKRTVTVAACDTFRAAADTQLAIWCDRAGVPLVSLEPGSDPAAVAVKALKQAEAENTSLILLDTAGRLHTKSNLMEELAKIKRVVKKYASENSRVETWLTIDGGTGQNALAQLREFGAAVPLSGLVVTKMDGSAKGGLLLGLALAEAPPIQMITLGEAMEAWQPFEAKPYVENLFSGLKA